MALPLPRGRLSDRRGGLLSGLVVACPPSAVRPVQKCSAGWRQDGGFGLLSGSLRAAAPRAPVRKCSAQRRLDGGPHHPCVCARSPLERHSSHAIAFAWARWRLDRALEQIYTSVIFSRGGGSREPRDGPPPAPGPRARCDCLVSRGSPAGSVRLWITGDCPVRSIPSPTVRSRDSPVECHIAHAVTADANRARDVCGARRRGSVPTAGSRYTQDA